MPASHNGLHARFKKKETKAIQNWAQ